MLCQNQHDKKSPTENELSTEPGSGQIDKNFIQQGIDSGSILSNTDRGNTEINLNTFATATKHVKIQSSKRVKPD